MKEQKIEFIQAEETDIDKGKIYAAENGRRHWIPSPGVAESYGWDLSQTKILPIDEVYQYARSYDIAYNYDNKFVPSVYKNNVVMHHVWDREWFGSQFTGHGLEISAASAPWPCRFGVEVDYTDPFDEDEGCKTEYENKDYVPLTYKASLEDMSAIAKKDYDFICCSHVIEHTPNVILALNNIYEHLAGGGGRHGVFVMAVPHMDYTFDCLRPLTTLSHIVSDYEDYNHERNLLHVVDYVENSQIKYSHGTADITQICESYLAGNVIDIHYHTFTEESMAQILSWFQDNVYKWNSMEIFNRSEGTNEFFVRLVK